MDNVTAVMALALWTPRRTCTASCSVLHDGALLCGAGRACPTYDKLSLIEATT